jgi:hypothetical protein
MTNQQELISLARDFLDASGLRDVANACEDYDDAFEIEYKQRDIGESMAYLIMKERNDEEDVRG